MIVEYKVNEFYYDDLLESEALHAKFPYSVIVEGEYLEHNNLTNWIKINIGNDIFDCVDYGKISYDYCFVEYFFKDNIAALKVSEIVPHIYTLYPLSPKPNRAVKSDGWEKVIEYNLKDEHAIIMTISNN